MADSFGLKIGLEGEKEFKKALADINQSFKVLGSEMKLATSQFDKNDQSVQALTARNTVLNKEIEAQKQKIETLRAALQNAADSFGENDRRTQNWQIQLNNAEAALNGMERELQDNNQALEQVESGFDGAGKEAEDFGKEVDKAGDQSEDAGGKLKKVGEIAADVGKAMAAAMVAIGTAAVAAGKKLWDMSNDVASAGDAIDKTSQKIGISAESYQEWDYVFQRCGSDVNNLQTGMKKLSGVITDAASGSDSAAEKLSAVGLSIEDLNGKSQDEQLSTVISALQKMGTGAERTAAANDLLGKSAVDMAAVLNMSAEETEALKQEAQDYGMVMSNEAVAASAAFEDSLTRLQGTMGGLKNRMVGELLPGITMIMDGLSDLVAGNDYAGQKLKDGVTSVYDTLAERYKSISLGQSKSSMITTISEVQSTVDKVESSVGRFPKLLQTAIGKATGLITGQSGGYVVINTDSDSGQPYELLILDAPSIDEAVNVWRWNVGGLGFSHNGYNGPYETAITADGQIVADFITSGSLVANIIKAGVIQSQDGSSWWDLESGEVVLRAYATSKEVTEVSDRITTIEEQKMLRLVIISSNGNIFKNGNVKTLLSAKVYSWDEDITDTLDANQFIWTRVSEDTEADKVWNEQHFGGAKSVVITGADVKVRATFYCDLIDTTTRQSLL